MKLERLNLEETRIGGKFEVTFPRIGIGLCSSHQFSVILTFHPIPRSTWAWLGNISSLKDMLLKELNLRGCTNIGGASPPQARTSSHQPPNSYPLLSRQHELARGHAARGAGPVRV